MRKRILCEIREHAGTETTVFSLFYRWTQGTRFMKYTLSHLNGCKQIRPLLPAVSLYQMIIFSAVNVCAEVKSVSVDVAKEQVLVETALSSAEVQALIEGTGRRAVLKGVGASQQGEELQNRHTFAIFFTFT